MAKVTDLKIQKQSGSDSYFATWIFNSELKTESSSSIKSGVYVKINEGSTYYNGVPIPSWVLSDVWKVIELFGDRAVLGTNKSGTRNIQSAINIKNLKTEGGNSVAVSKNTLDHYEVKWSYDTGDNIWFSEGTSDVTENVSTYTAPTNAIRIKISVTPVSKTYTVNEKEVSYWSGTSTTVKYSLSYDPPEVPAVPSIEMNNLRLTATVKNISDSKTDDIEFEIYNELKRINKGISTVLMQTASYSCSVSSGSTYRVRCRAVNNYGSIKKYSEWSDYSDAIGTNPSKISKFSECKATSDTSVYLSWNLVLTATTYEIQYTTKKEYFEGSDQIESISGIETLHYEKTGLESGTTYFFRICAVNDNGKSDWSDISSIVLGEKPAPPTTWSSDTRSIIGENVYLYWTHNSIDGSRATYSEIELYINDEKENTVIKNDIPEKDDNGVYIYKLDTTKYSEGTSIKWRIRTAGITEEYSDWSTQREIQIYSKPTMDLSLKDLSGEEISIIKSFPFIINCLTGPKTQKPIGYNITIISLDGYISQTNTGESIYISPESVIYSKYLDIHADLTLELTASDVTLENNFEYKLACSVFMDSGLSADSEIIFSVDWEDADAQLDVEMGLDRESLSVYLRPYGLVDGLLDDSLLLSVYRKEFNGDFIEIGSDLDNNKNIMIIDPHPSLNLAQYRIVSKSKRTGKINFYDPPGYPINEKAIVIQWDENRIEFNGDDENTMSPQPWSGSMIKLPYNINVSEDTKRDSMTVKYAGRMYPVCYYGEWIESSGTWSTEIPKKDIDTLSSLRRLSIWNGNVYIREPSGIGFWANISISMDQKYDSLTIPITISVTRVDGGV